MSIRRPNFNNTFVQRDPPMVHLNRISTRTGDEGDTSLGDGTRVPKTSLRVIALGSVDELNASLGVVRATDSLDPDVASLLTRIQNDLFDIGAELCVPRSSENALQQPSGLEQGAIARLEGAIDQFNEDLAPLSSFILPGGTTAAALLHLGRTQCRRVEIDVLKLADDEDVNRCVPVYLNRLSDLLFVLARVCNQRAGGDDILWQPHQGAR